MDSLADKFKKKHGHQQSYSTNATNNNIKVDFVTRKIQLSKIKGLTFRMCARQSSLTKVPILLPVQYFSKSFLQKVLSSGPANRSISGLYIISSMLNRSTLSFMIVMVAI
jgi:hypothetical protein